jgi:hypothetical protein
MEEAISFKRRILEKLSSHLKIVPFMHPLTSYSRKAKRY